MQRASSSSPNLNFYQTKWALLYLTQKRLHDVLGQLAHINYAFFKQKNSEIIVGRILDSKLSKEDFERLHNNFEVLATNNKVQTLLAKILMPSGTPPRAVEETSELLQTRDFEISALRIYLSESLELLKLLHNCNVNKHLKLAPPVATLIDATINNLSIVKEQFIQITTPILLEDNSKLNKTSVFS